MGSMQAAAGSVDLTPPVGAWMSGFAARIEPARAIHDPIMARALLLSDGAAALAIVVCDLVGLTPLAAAGVRDAIERETDGAIPAGSILLSCTHTHSGPASMPLRGVMGYVDAAWLHDAEERIAVLVAGLAPRLRPARFARAASALSDIGYNRQDPSHPVDEELGVLAVDGMDGEAIATLASYATHAVVLGPSNLLLSADFPREAARCLAAARGGVGLYLQGACGDGDPLVYRQRGWGTGTHSHRRPLHHRGAVRTVRGDRARHPAQALRPLPVMIAGYANGLYGYCPTRIARDQGGYGPGGSHRWFPQLLTPVGHGAEELLVAEASALARESGLPAASA